MMARMVRMVRLLDSAHLQPQQDLLVSQQAGRTLLRYSHSVFLKERPDLLVRPVLTEMMGRRLDLEHLLQAQDQLV